MKACIRLFTLSLILLAPNALTAQDAEEVAGPGILAFQQGILPGVLYNSQNQLADSVMRPVLDVMVDEGIINNWGILTHNWGDEWNWNWYMSATDHHALVSAWDSVVARIEARTPGGLDAVYAGLEAHKDNIYTVAHLKSSEPVEGEEPPGFLMFNQHRISDFEAVDKLNDSVTKPILDTMVDEGILNSWGVLQHQWADEWNWNYWMITKDHASFVSAWSDYVGRVTAADSTFFQEFSKYSIRHKDNLYRVQYAR
jgi:hypothetical protein